MHGPNYSRPPPDLVNDQEEYKVEKILDSQRHGRRWTLQYLVKWKGYPDSDNEWVNQKDVHANEKIREFKNSNPTSEAHINQGKMGKSLILSSPSYNTTTTPTLMSHAVNSYYLSSPGCIFGAELDSQLITYHKAQELCAKKYI